MKNALVLLLLTTLTISACTKAAKDTSTQASLKIYIPKNNGIVCVAAPCFVWDIQDAQGKFLTRASDIHLDYLRLDLEKRQKLLKELFRGERKVKGYFKIIENAGAAGNGKALVITEVLEK